MERINKNILRWTTTLFHGILILPQTCQQVKEDNLPPNWVWFRLHPVNVIVLCILGSSGVISSYFFENTQERYGRLLYGYFQRQIEDYNLEVKRFQQDESATHATQANRALMQEIFAIRVIARRIDVNWPARSSDLTPLDFFLWDYAKDHVYEDNPQTLSQIKANTCDNAIRKCLPVF